MVPDSMAKMPRMWHSLGLGHETKTDPTKGLGFRGWGLGFRLRSRTHLGLWVRARVRDIQLKSGEFNEQENG